MNPEFIPFQLERMMSIWENQVEYNLSESGVHPMTVGELLSDPKESERIFDISLGYPQTNGLPELRARVADLYPGATEENVLITTGCAQANFTALMTIGVSGDEVAILLPNYMQLWGAAKNMGMQVRTFQLASDNRWSLDVDSLQEAITATTKLIAICNPNNPTGHIMDDSEVKAVIDAAENTGAWVLADEVYSGSERVTDKQTPTLWGRYDRTIITASMSKAYGLPGLRIGWVVAPKSMIDQIWARQDYITISTTMIANKLAAFALAPEKRQELLSRTRAYIRKGYEYIEDWASQQRDLISFTPPDATAVLFVRYEREQNSSELCRRLIEEQSVYIVPGDHFGIDQHLRISFGLERSYLEEGLRRVREVLIAPG